MFVYMTENMITGKKYIGKTVKPETHQYFGSGKYLKRALKKYGKENFKRIVLERCSDEDELKSREEFWINYYNAHNSNEFYNISEYAKGGHHGLDYRGEKNPMYGKKHPNHVPHFGKQNGMFGSHRILSENPNSKKVIIIDCENNVYEGGSIKEVCISIFGDEKNYTKMTHMVRLFERNKKPGKNSMFYGWKARIGDKK